MGILDCVSRRLEGGLLIGSFGDSAFPSENQPIKKVEGLPVPLRLKDTKTHKAENHHRRLTNYTSYEAVLITDYPITDY